MSGRALVTRGRSRVLSYESDGGKWRDVTRFECIQSRATCLPDAIKAREISRPTEILYEREYGSRASRPDRPAQLFVLSIPPET